MPRNVREALGFLLGFWIALAVLVPLAAPPAFGATDELPTMEQAIHHAVNGFRREHRLIALERRTDLDAVARAHSEDMVARRFFAHEDPEGRNWVDRLRAAGVDGFALAGENVGLSSQSPAPTAIFQGWERSPDHRSNLLARPYNSTGIGAARAPDGTVYITQLYVTFPR